MKLRARAALVMVLPISQLSIADEIEDVAASLIGIAEAMDRITDKATKSNDAAGAATLMNGLAEAFEKAAFATRQSLARESAELKGPTPLPPIMEATKRLKSSHGRGREFMEAVRSMKIRFGSAPSVDQAIARVQRASADYDNASRELR